uniref:Uncharacterized protein n=1 Tax=Microcebus murinus TaxID=30608 RepID=A0A8C5Y0H0_MICMU
MEAIFSAADSGFNGSLVDIFVLTNPAAYMGTITGCFLLIFQSTNKLTMFLPCASWISCSSVHTSSSSLTYPFSGKASLVFIGKVLVSSKCFREVTSSSASGTNMEGKHASKIRSSRFSKAVCIKTSPKSLFSFNFNNLIVSSLTYTLSTTVKEGEKPLLRYKNH